MNPYLSKNQPEKVDPITRMSIAETKAKMSKLNGIIQEPVKQVAKKSGLSSSDKLLEQAMSNHKYNQDNKYRVSGLNVSNRTGDTMGRIANALFK